VPRAGCSLSFFIGVYNDDGLVGQQLYLHSIGPDACWMRVGRLVTKTFSPQWVAWTTERQRGTHCRVLRGWKSKRITISDFGLLT